MDGVIVTLDAPSFEGPFYMNDAGLPDKDLTETSSKGLAAITGVPPWDYTLTTSHPSLTCETWIGFTTGTPNKSRLSVEAGRLTPVAVICK